MPTLRQRYEKAKKNSRLTGRKALGKRPKSEEAKAYRSARAEYHRLGEALMRQSRGEVRGTPRKRQFTMKPQIISSQDYLDPDIVERKRRDKDFDVLLSPEFDYEGRTFRVVLDGHHSLEAARQSRRKPRFLIAKPNEIEGFGLTGNGDDGVAEFLQMHYNGNDWRNIATNGPATWGPPKRRS